MNIEITILTNATFETCYVLLKGLFKMLCACNKPYGGDQYDHGSLCVMCMQQTVWW